MKVIALVPAAGFGRRLGYRRAKPFISLVDKPVLAHTLTILQQAKKINAIILIVDKKQLESAVRLVSCYRINKVKAIVSGGRTRSGSVRNGLKAISEKTDFVLIHDAARPLLTVRLVNDCIEAALRYKAVVCALPCSATIKSVDKNNNVIMTLDRNRLWQIQTPQIFSYSLIKKAYGQRLMKEKYCFDDASLVERLPHKVKVIPGLETNIKITTPKDLQIARAILKSKKRG